MTPFGAMGFRRRVQLPLSDLTERLLDDLLLEMKSRWPTCTKAGLAGLALHRGLVEMKESLSVASGAPMVELRRAG